jgi:hypothetical protein
MSASPAGRNGQRGRSQDVDEVGGVDTANLLDEVAARNFIAQKALAFGPLALVFFRLGRTDLGTGVLDAVLDARPAWRRPSRQRRPSPPMRRAGP